MPLKPKTAKVNVSGVPLELLTAADKNPFLRMGIYGRSGVGKTLLAATACEVPDMSPVLVLDCGESSDTLLGEPQFKDVHIMRIRTLDDLSQVYAWLAPESVGGENAAANYKTIIIDEFDELHTQTMREVMGIAVRLNPSQDQYVPSPREWGIMRSKMLEIIDWMKILPVNLIWVCTPNVKEDQYTSRDQFTLGLPGKLSDDVAKRLGLTAYMQVVTKKVKNGMNFDEVSRRTIHFAPTGAYLTKVRGLARAQRLGAEMEDPTMEKIWRAWIG